MRILTKTTALAALLLAGACDTKQQTSGIDPRFDGQCNFCHGDREAADPEVPATWAPPRAFCGDVAGCDDAVGLTATTERAVGAHQSHLRDGDIRAAIACSDCHVVPEHYTDEGHFGLLPAEITFSAFAGMDGLMPAWSPSTLRCTNVYCHGATLEGGMDTAPLWNVVDESQSQCDSCHGEPPPPPHPPALDCQRCHPGTVLPTGEIDIAGGQHIDGQIQLVDQCNGCHGDATADAGEPANWAPPVSLSGEMETTAIGVGAHQSHLRDGDLREGIACGECHVVPAAVTTPGHVDTAPPAELTFGPLATEDGAAPAWDRTVAECSNTYCHGSTLAIGGGTNTTPTWTVVDGSESACGTCHGAPPPPPHTPLTVCRACHPDTVNAMDQIDVAGGFHINGTVEFERFHDEGWYAPGGGAHRAAANARDPEWPGGLSSCKPCHGLTLQGEGTTGSSVPISCDSCHSGWKTNCVFCHGGTDNTEGSPPVDLLDNTATTVITVGAHTSHVEGRVGFGATVPCEECHTKPADALAAGHVDPTPAEVTFGVRATNNGLVAPIWNRPAATCSATYCHGNFPGGVTTNTPQWTIVGVDEAACLTCHDVPPPTGDHAAHQTLGIACDGCHPNFAGINVIDPTTHVDGVGTVNVAPGTWDAGTNTCDPVCHDSRTW